MLSEWTLVVGAVDLCPQKCDSVICNCVSERPHTNTCVFYYDVFLFCISLYCLTVTVVFCVAPGFCVVQVSTQ